MSDTLKVPPKKDFDSFASLMDDESDHFGELKDWVGKHCHDARDLTGLLVWPIAEFAPHIADLFTGKLSHCQHGMTSVAGKARETAKDYADNEHATIHSFSGIFGTPLSHFPDFGEVSGLEHLGDFRDADLELEKVEKKMDEAGEVTAKNIQHQLFLLGFGTDPGAKGFQEGKGSPRAPVSPSTERPSV